MRLFGSDTNAQKVEMLKNIPIFQELTGKEILELSQAISRSVKEKFGIELSLEVNIVESRV